MLSLIEDNTECGYRIYRSDVILKHQQEMLRDLSAAHKLLIKTYGSVSKDSTWLYKTYNIFSLVGPRSYFTDLYKDLLDAIKITAPTDEYLWFQSWLNVHRQDQVLKWHNHSWYIHGYISVDPKRTKTVFDNYEIENDIGNIYIGPGNRRHKVQVVEPYDGHRITIGFDVTNTAFGPSDSMSLIPVI